MLQGLAEDNPSQFNEFTVAIEELGKYVLHKEQNLSNRCIEALGYMGSLAVPHMVKALGNQDGFGFAAKGLV